MSSPGTPVLWLWVTRAILQNDRVEDFPADDAAPPREGRRAGTDLQIHERLFHHQIVTAWASHDEVGFCRTPAHGFLFETTARRSPNATGVARGTAEVLAWTNDEPPVGAAMCHRGPGLQPDPVPSRDQVGRLASSPSFAQGLLRVANSAFPGSPASPGDNPTGANKALLFGHASPLSYRRLNLDVRPFNRRQLTGSLRLQQPGIIGIDQLLARMRIL